MSSGSLLLWGGMRSWDKSSDSVSPPRPCSVLALWLGVGKAGHRERGRTWLCCLWSHGFLRPPQPPPAQSPRTWGLAVGQGRSWARAAAGQSISGSTCSLEFSVSGHLCPSKLLSKKHHTSRVPEAPGGGNGRLGKA